MKFTIPDYNIAESNDCHTPGGSPAGGEFCSDPKANGPTGTRYRVTLRDGTQKFYRTWTPANRAWASGATAERRMSDGSWLKVERAALYPYKKKEAPGGDVPELPSTKPVPTLKWKVRKVTVQAGVYPESNVQVPEQFTPDGRFSIHKVGGMGSRRSSGFRGPLVNKFRWRGYQLTDNSPTLPDYVVRSKRFANVAGAKREAENRARKYPTGETK